MYPTIFRCVAAVAAFLLFKLILALITRKRRNAAAVTQGCAPVPSASSKMDPFGLSRIISALKASREDRGPQHHMEVMDSVGHDIHTIQVRILDFTVLLTRDPENVKAMFSTQFQNFEIGSLRAENWEPLLGVGIFTLRGEAWRHSRALVRSQFSNEQISDLALEERHVQALIGVLQVREDGWTDLINLGPLFYNFTLDSATEFLYGHSVHSQHPNAHSAVEDLDNPKQAGFGYHLDGAKEWIFTKGIFGKWQWLIYSREFLYHCKEVHRYVDWYVQASLSKQRFKSDPLDEAVSQEEESSGKKYVLLNELAKYSQDALVLRNETLQLLNAGRDTTGALLGWTFYFLARHPPVYEKLRSTILADFGPSSNKIEFAKLKSCRYLHHCINESFRIAAVVPLNERVCVQDTTLPRGGGPDGTKPIFIPKGRRILISTYAMQHRADIWGADVEEFKPERWEKHRIGWEFIPFGGGQRKCIGRKFFLLLHVSGY